MNLQKTTTKKFYYITADFLDETRATLKLARARVSALRKEGHKNIRIYRITKSEDEELIYSKGNYPR